MVVGEEVGIKVAGAHRTEPKSQGPQLKKKFNLNSMRLNVLNGYLTQSFY